MQQFEGIDRQQQDQQHYLIHACGAVWTMTCCCTAASAGVIRCVSTGTHMSCLYTFARHVWEIRIVNDLQIVQALFNMRCPLVSASPACMPSNKQAACVLRVCNAVSSSLCTYWSVHCRPHVHKLLCSNALREVQAVAAWECDGISQKRLQPTLLRHISHQNKSVKMLHKWSLRRLCQANLAVMKGMWYHKAVL